MKKWTAIAAALFLVSGSLFGCGKDTPGTDTGTDGSSSAGSSSDASADASGETTADFSLTDADMFTDRDCRADYEEDDSIRIELNGDSAAADSDAVSISGSTITLTEEAVYLISGPLDDGMIIVDAADTAKLQLVFDGADINSETCAPLYILEADKVFVTLADGSENTLSNGGTFTAIDDSNIDSVIFSKQDLTLNGSGSLTVTSPAGHGIVSKDDLVITGGTYTVTSSSHALDANDSVRITGDTAITANAGKDGIHAENNDDASLGFVYISGGTLNISSEGDGISAGAYMHITDGDFQILAGGGSVNGTKESSDNWGNFGGGMGGGMGGGRGGMGGDPGSMGMDPGSPGSGNHGSTSSGDSARNDAASSNAAVTTAAVTAVTDSTTTDTTDADDGSTSMKGIKATGDMLISGGTFTIDSADDGVHSNTSVTVDGGSFEIASGDDGFHADEALTVVSGTIHISECYEGLEALDLRIEGGDITLVADDDGLNAAGGTDASGTEGGRDGMFGGGHGGMGGDPGAGGMSSSNGSLVISGGTLDITASGDGIDANGTVEISGGYIVVTGPTQGDTSTLDYDTTAVITGGTFIGTGASGMAQTFSDSEQGVIAVSVGEQSAGSTVTIQDKDGNDIVSFEPDLSFAVVIVSSPDIESGETYTLTVGSISGDVEAD